MTRKLTLAAARQQLRAIGYTLTKVDGEYGICPSELRGSSRELGTYYTNDLSDAVATAQRMHERQTAYLSAARAAAASFRGEG